MIYEQLDQDLASIQEVRRKVVLAAEAQEGSF